MLRYQISVEKFWTELQTVPSIPKLNSKGAKAQSSDTKRCLGTSRPGWFVLPMKPGLNAIPFVGQWNPTAEQFEPSGQVEHVS